MIWSLKLRDGPNGGSESGTRCTDRFHPQPPFAAPLCTGNLRFLFLLRRVAEWLTHEEITAKHGHMSSEAKLLLFSSCPLPTLHSSNILQSPEPQTHVLLSPHCLIDQSYARRRHRRSHRPEAEAMQCLSLVEMARHVLLGDSIPDFDSAG